MQRADHRFYGFLTGRVFPCGQLLQQGNGVLKAQAALLDESRILRPYIAPVPRLIGDLGDGFGVLGIPQDEAVLHGVGLQPSEGRRLFKARVKAGVLRAVQVGGKAAVVLE